MNNLKRFFLKYRLNIASGLTILLTFIAVLSIYFALEVRVTSNDECIWQPTKIEKDSTAILFEKVKVDGVTFNAGIKNGDELLEINGVPIKDIFVAQSILNKIKSGDYADYKIRKPDGKVIETRVFIKKLINFASLAQCITGLLFLLIGFIVYSAKPDGLSQKLFFALGIFYVIADTIVLFNFDLSYIRENPFQSLIAISIVLTSRIVVQFFLLYFVWTFPKPFAFVMRKSFQIIVIIIFALISISGIVATASIGGRQFISFDLYNLYQNILRIIFIAIYVVAWISMIVQYVREKTTANKKPLLLFVIAFTIGIIVQFYASAIAIQQSLSSSSIIS